MDEFSRHNQKTTSSFDLTSVPQEAVVTVGCSDLGMLSCFQGGMVVEWPSGGDDGGLQFCIGLSGSCPPIGLETRLGRDFKEQPQLSPQRNSPSPFQR